MVAASFERTAIAEFFGTPFAVIEVGEGREGGGEFPTIFSLSSNITQAAGEE